LRIARVAVSNGAAKAKNAGADKLLRSFGFSDTIKEFSLAKARKKTMQVAVLVTEY